jgi:hypothetical protein
VDNEPVSLAGAVNAAIAATMAVLIGAEIVSPEVGALLLACLVAWIGVAAWFVRARVTPWPPGAPPPDQPPEPVDP